MKKQLNRQKMKLFKQQAGWTFWSLLFTLLVLGFFAYIGMQLVPIHMQNENIKNAMVQSVEGVNLRKVTRNAIIGKMNRQLYLDQAHELLDFKRDLKVTKKSNEFKLELNYTREVPIVADHYVMVKFNPTLICDLSGNCEEG